MTPSTQTMSYLAFTYSQEGYNQMSAAVSVCVLVFILAVAYTHRQRLRPGGDHVGHCYQHAQDLLAGDVRADHQPGQHGAPDIAADIDCTASVLICPVSYLETGRSFR